MKVLLVLTDDKTLRDSLRQALPDEDLALFEWTTDDAIRRIVSLKADMIIVDDTPRLGRDAVRSLHEAAPDIPVLALTRWDDAETISELVQAGATRCLTKPFSCHELAISLDPHAPPQGSLGEVPLVSTAGAEATALAQYKTAMRWAGRIASKAAVEKDLGEVLVDAVVDIFEVARCAVLFDDGQGFRIAGARGIPESIVESFRPRFHSGLVRSLERRAHLLEWDPTDPSDTAREMQVLGMRLAMPILVAGELRGALLLGERALGQPHTDDDRELLCLVTRLAAAVLDARAEAPEHTTKEASPPGMPRPAWPEMRAGLLIIAPNETILHMNAEAKALLEESGAREGAPVHTLSAVLCDAARTALVEKEPVYRQGRNEPEREGAECACAIPTRQGYVAILCWQMTREPAHPDPAHDGPFWEFLASRLAREIKAPLSAIDTFAQLLPRRYESEEFREAFAATTQREMERANHIVEVLSEFALLPRLSLQQTDINAFVRNTLRTFEEEFAQKGIRIETHWDAEEPEEIWIRSIFLRPFTT